MIDLELLAAEIRATLRHRGENDDLVVSRQEDGWLAQASNPSAHVDIGEVAGRYAGTGLTIEASLLALRDAL